ncbi:nucleoside triphosphate pyrophosphohydrolase family protein [Neptuniibacter sp. QD37_11]|uniref:nucleoside triphosphate pyrophosphohydrolase family protein n=1 Tax=Neptuniibacter sp. QD37_11 TaxID=3398209 RepID=UPI0039F49048
MTTQATNFENVTELNLRFGNVKGDPENIDWKAAGKQSKLIQEELAELLEGIEDKDQGEIRDAIADILVTTYGMAHVMGVDADKDMAAVQASNMSKLCQTQAEIDATQDHYKAMGVETYVGGEFPHAYVKSSIDQDDNEGKHYPAHKFLKNVNWFEPKLT